MINRLLIVLIAGLCVIMGNPAAQAVQAGRNVLEPENANEARLNRLQPPEKVMDAFEIRPGMTVAEIGAGQGRYVVQLAVRVGENGRIFAEDIDRRALDYLARRCARGGLRNVETIVGDIDDPKLPDNRLDRIFIISSYHHFDDPVALLKKARAALKPDGKLAIGEWFPEPGHEGTPPETIKAQMEGAGYVLEKTDTSLRENRMYLYLFKAGR